MLLKLCYKTWTRTLLSKSSPKEKKKILSISNFFILIRQVVDWYKANTYVFDTIGCHCQELLRDTIDLYRNSSVFLIILSHMDLLRLITKYNIEVPILLKIPLTKDLNGFLLKFSTTTDERWGIGFVVSNTSTWLLQPNW